MKENISCRRIGVDLVPLPHESSLSILWRLSWRNVLSGIHLKRALNDTNIKVMKDSFLKYRWLQSNRLSEETGWLMPQDSEVEVFDGFGPLLFMYFDEKLRICPLCLEYGYHSYWHQCRELTHCPIHDCALTNACSSCGVALPDYRFSRELFGQPYLCHVCQKPLSGGPVTLPAHLDFRTHSSHISRAFAPFQTWAEKGRREFWMVRSILKFYPYNAQWQNWARPNDFLRGIAQHFCSAPGAPQACFTGGITVLSWRLRMCTMINPAYSDFIQTRVRQYIKKSSLRTKYKVYLATLRLLQNWIIGSRESGENTAQNELQFGQDRKVNVENWDPKELAYILMRMSLEPGDWPQLRDPVGEFTSLAHGKPLLKVHSFEGRTPRLAWRSIFIGMYAYFYWIVIQAKRKGTLDLYNLTANFESLVAKYYFIEEGDYLCGGIVFPTVPGLPLTPFRRGTQLGSANFHSPPKSEPPYPDAFRWEE